MIVWKTENVDTTHCLVRVEGIEPGVPDTTVRLFALGAAARHNPGYDATAAGLEWCDEHGRPLPVGSDTTCSTIARVLCTVADTTLEEAI